MTTPAKLFGKNLGEYDEVDVDELLAQLSAEEIKILAKEVDPDVSINATKYVPPTTESAFAAHANGTRFITMIFVGQFLAAESTDQLRLRERTNGTIES